MFFCWFLPFCIRRRIRYSIRRRMSYIRHRIPKIQYRIANIWYLTRHRIKCAISYVFVAGSCHFGIRRRIRYRMFLYDVLYDIVHARRYYTISYNNIVCLVAIIRYRTSISQKTYDVTVRCRIRFFLQVPGLAFAAGRTGHAPHWHFIVSLPYVWGYPLHLPVSPPCFAGIYTL
jgi:hypothetical protein